MPVYIRTAAGNEAALNPQSALPRKLRSLLISINGRTRLSTYVSSLSSFGDVEALLQSLLQAGLIRVSEPQIGADSVSTDTFGTTPGNTFDKATHASWRTTDAGNTPWQGTQGGGTQAPVDDLLSWSKFQQPPTAPVASYSPPAPRPGATTADYQLRNAIRLMSDFVSQHMPLESLELVLTLEGLRSVEQVLTSLKGYEAMIAHLGEPARKHMAELRRVLSSA